MWASLTVYVLSVFCVYLVTLIDFTTSAFDPRELPEQQQRELLRIRRPGALACRQYSVGEGTRRFELRLPRGIFGKGSATRRCLPRCSRCLAARVLYGSSLTCESNGRNFCPPPGFNTVAAACAGSSSKDEGA